MRRTKLGVLLISPFFRPNVGGVETHLNDLCKYLRNKGHSVYVITYQPLTINERGISKERSENLEIRRISWFGHEIFHTLEPYPSLEFIYLTPLLFFYSLLFVLRHKRKINVIHGHGMNAAFISSILAGIFETRSVGTLHTIYRLQNRPFLAALSRKILSRLDTILVVSNQAKKELVEAGLKPEKISVFRYWVDLSVFKPLDKVVCKSKLGLSNKFVALFVGRFIESKGVRLVLKVVSELREATFLFVGDGPLRNEVEMAASTMKNVIFLGKLPNSLLPVYYNAADVLVWGNPDMDYIGRVTIEALSCGLPVIGPIEVNLFGVTKKVSIEINNASILTLILPDSVSLVQKLEYFLRNAKELTSLSLACRSYAVAHYGEKNAEIVLYSYLPTNNKEASINRSHSRH